MSNCFWFVVFPTRQLQRLCTYHQQCHLAVHKMRLGDDPALSLAYASSMRTSVVPRVVPGGNFHALPRRYLDSTTLQHHLMQARLEPFRVLRTLGGGTSRGVRLAASGGGVQASEGNRRQEIRWDCCVLDVQL